MSPRGGSQWWKMQISPLGSWPESLNPRCNGQLHNRNGGSMRRKLWLAGLAVAALCVLAALPALADTQFRVRQMTRNDVPLGKGQCDIRLRVDGEVEVSVRGDMVYVRTISGRDARDEGSECNDPFPARDIQNFRFEVGDSRGEIRLLSPPSRNSNFAAVVRIRDSQGGEGRYQFRLTWAMTGAYQGGGGDMRFPGPRDDMRRLGPDRGRPGWNDSVEFRGRGSGTYTRSNERRRQLYNAEVSVDRDGRVRVRFDTSFGGPLAFMGRITTASGSTLTADVEAGDQTRGLRGPMIITLDNRRQVSSVAMEGTAGRRDSFRLRWQRR
jgi:hypothetical protein